MEIRKVYPGNGDSAQLVVVLTQQDIDNLNNGNPLDNNDIWFGGSENEELPIRVQVVKTV